jgi:chromosome segregation protein
MNVRHAMYLKRLEIQGFKTFAARTMFEFRPGITAVVGPNGSGKSNLTDAIRWVLGEQSFAALRSKRTEDLLFGGGGRRAPSGLAEVSLTIDNSDRLLALPYGEVTLTRRATRAGDNEYFINRNRVRLRDIQEAIGPLGGSYTIVNQGMVDSALTLRPEERRRLFEDAAEISAFESRKAETERKLRETDVNLDRCADMLSELEPRLRSLKRQASLARTHREMTSELRGLLLRQYAQLWQAAKQARAEAEAAAERLEQELAQRRAAQAAATAELRASRDQLRALRERLGALHAESSALHTRAEAAQRDLAVGVERQAALTRRGEEFERSQREFELRHDELERERAAVAARLGEAEARLAEQRQAAMALERTQNERGQERRARRQALEQAQRAEAQAAAATAELERRDAQLSTRAEQLTQERASQATALAAAQVALQARHTAQAQAQAHLPAAEHQRAEAAAAAEQARADLEALRAERGQADEAVAQARRALLDAEARLETLGRLQREFAGTFAGVKAAMRWAESQGRAGFALVASIVRTPAHLETAVEVALGARLQNIVVERWDDAEAAIAALKQSGAGRATFLPLDTIRGQGSGVRGQGTPADSRSPISDPDVLGIAADLVEYDAPYRAVVQYLLGRTLVVRDLSTARDVLRQLSGGWTIVTLAGEQISSGGAVTGGAQTKESGTLRRERELRELPGTIATRREGVDTAIAARAALETRLGSAERALQAVEATRRQRREAYDAARESSERERRQAERAQADLDWQQRRHTQAEDDLRELETQRQALVAERATLAARVAEAQQHLDRLRAEEQAHAEEDRQAQQQLDALRAAVAATEGEARAERALLQSHTHNLQRLGTERAETERRRADLDRERTQLDAQLRALDQSHAALLAEIDALRAQIDPAEAELVALEEGQAGLERRESELTGALLDGETAHGRASVEVQRARDRLDTLWERAAADDIDIEEASQATNDERRTTNTELEPEQGAENQELGAENIAQDSTLKTQNSPAETDNLQSQIDNLKSRIQRLGVVNPLALEEYEETAERHTFLSSQSDDLRRASAALRELIAELDAAMRSRFEITFRAVAVEFEHSFTRLFGGGQAQLLLVHPNGNGASNGNGVHDNHESIDGLGIEILARPPGKRQQTLSLLSGGERSLTAAALLFAILKVNPSPFCVLDEVDAALDEANVGRFRSALTDLSEQTQFLLVTHNRGTIEAADTIYGVSMGDDGASKVLSLRLEELVEE